MPQGFWPAAGGVGAGGFLLRSSKYSTSPITITATTTPMIAPGLVFLPDTGDGVGVDVGGAGVTVAVGVGVATGAGAYTANSVKWLTCAVTI